MPNGVLPVPLIHATCAILDFLYLAQYRIHTSETLASLEAALNEFHEKKHVFETLGIQNNFNIPKLHFLCHYILAIKLFRTTDNYNTEMTECLHIDFAKDTYQATNHKDEFSQMTEWLEHQEKIMHHRNYIAWRTAQAVPTIPPPPHLTSSYWEPPDMACTLFPKMTHHPTRKSVPLADIISPNGYGATDFEAALF